jgi:F0F1-type ATP synthase assembly protein I
LEVKEKGKPEVKECLPVSDGPPFFSTTQPESVSPDLVNRLAEKVADLTYAMEKMNMAEYIQLLNRPFRLLYINFISGVARGVGFAVGFALLGAILVYLLQKIVILNLPVIGGFIADIVEMVQHQVKVRGY